MTEFLNSACENYATPRIVKRTLGRMNETYFREKTHDFIIDS